MSASDTNNKKTTIWTRGFTCVVIANVCISLAMFAVNTYITTYMGFLGVGAGLTGLIAGIYFSVAFLLRPVSGPAITMLNKKKLMIIVYASGIFINLGYALFSEIGMFIAVRMFHGVQLAFSGSLAMTIATDSLPEEKIASGLGVYGLSGIVAQAFGPGMAIFIQTIGEAIGGEQGGFRAIFLTAAVLAAISVIPCFLLPDNKISDEEAKTLGTWYKNIVAKEALSPSIIIMLLSMSAILFSTYLIPYGLWKNITNISIYFTINAVVTLAARPLAGKLTDKYGPAKIFFPGIIIYIMAFLAISNANDIKLIIISAICASAGFGAINPAVQTMAVQAVSPLKRGVASNTLFFGMDLGFFLGPTLAGLVLGRYNYEIMFRLAIIPLLLSMVIFALGWKPYLRQREILTSMEEDIRDNL